MDRMALKKGAPEMMTDQWNEVLRCTQCTNTGRVSLYQPDGAGMPTVRSVSDSFKVMRTEYGPYFRCGVCDVPTIP
jgi:hypothetical protein